MTYSQFLELFLSLSLQATLLIICTNWLCRFTRDEGMATRLWTGCFVGLLMQFFAGVLAPHPRLFYPWAGILEAKTVEIGVIQSRIGQSVFLVWFAGFSVIFLMFAVQFICLARYLSKCRPLGQTSETLRQNAIRAMGDLPEADQVVLLIGSGLKSPFCWQFRRPVIALPENLLTLSTGELRSILRHEYEHLRSGHPLQVFVQRLVEVVFWFHPMVWWASYQASLCREFACDDAATDSPGDIAAYLRTMLKIIEQGAPRKNSVSFSLDFGRDSMVLAKRARRLLERLQQPESEVSPLRFGIPLRLSLYTVVVVLMFAWLPVDIFASPRAAWSPWPSWSAGVLHDFGIQALDFEPYDTEVRPFELHERDALVEPRIPLGNPQELHSIPTRQ